MLILLGPGTGFSDLARLGAGGGGKAAQIVQFDGSDILLRGPDGEEWRLGQPDMLCLGLIHTAADADLATVLQQWWLDKSGVPLACCRLARDESDERRRLAAAEWIAERLAAIVDLLGAENKSILNQNRLLRKSYGALQTAFSRVEQFVMANHLHTPVLQYEPKRLASFWRPERRGDKLTQLLPVLSSRLSYFELNFRKPTEGRPGNLRIAVRLEPAARVLREWVIDYRDVLEGWNSFSPGAVIDEPNEVVLECVWSEAAGAPAIGFSPPHWETPYAAVPRAATGPWPSIGARIWSGIAGLRPPQLTNAPRERGQAQGRFRELSPDELIGATQHKFAATIERDYASVRYLDKLGRLLVHPHRNVPTIAQLPSPLPPGIARVSADIRAGVAEAPDIAYAMAVVPPDASPVELFTDGGDAAPGFSGWHLLHGEQARRIGVVLEPPAGPGCRLFLATRLRDGSSEARAWATWGAIELSDAPAPADGADGAAVHSNGAADQTSPAAPRDDANVGRSGAPVAAPRARPRNRTPVAAEPAAKP